MKSRTCVTLIFVSLLFAMVFTSEAPIANIASCHLDWDSEFGMPGANGEVYVLYSTDGPPPFGPALYAGGSFTTIGGESASCIARWDGDEWTALGEGVGEGSIHCDLRVAAITVFDDGSGPALYVGGDFIEVGGISANNIAKWDGTSWSPLGSGIDKCVLALAVFDDGSGDALYAGGFFNEAGGTPAKGIARWNGSFWSPVGAGLEAGGGAVEDLVVFNDGTADALYAGGSFTASAGEFRNRIAKWNPGGGTWDPVGGGVEFGEIMTLAVFDDGSGDALYAGGTFIQTTDEPPIPLNFAAKWNGAQWVPLGAGMDGWVLDMAVFDDVTGTNVPALFAVGKFDSTGGAPCSKGIACWRGDNWQSVGEGIDWAQYSAGARTLSPFQNGMAEWLYVGGEFYSANGEPADNITRLKGACPISTIIQGFSCSLIGNSVRLTWDFESADLIRGFHILRRSHGRPYEIPLNRGELLSPSSRSYVDNDVMPGQTYEYQLEIVRADGSGIRSHKVTISIDRCGFALHQNEPNPFYPTTMIRFDLPEKTGAELRIFNVKGGLVRTLLDSEAPAGANEVYWDGRDSQGRSVEPGIYFYRLSTPSFTQTRKMILLGK